MERAKVTDGISPATAAGPLAEAERALYVDDVERARELAGSLDSPVWLDAEGERGQLARRARLMLAEAAYLERDFATADELARTIADAAGDADELATMRALYVLARTAFRRGRLSLAADRLTAVDAIATALGDDLHRALVLYFRAQVAVAGDDTREGARLCSAALEALPRGAERSRGHVLNLLGSCHAEAGDFAAALRCFDEAGRIAGELGVESDGLWIRANVARALVLSGNAAGAADRFGALVSEHRSAAHPAEGMALYWLAVALTDLGRLDEAADAARAMQSFADVAGSEGDRLAGRIVAARIASDSDELRAVLHESALTDYQRAEVLIALADVARASTPDEAARLRDEAAALGAVHSSARLRAALDRLTAALARSAVRVDGARFTVNPELGEVTASAATAALERFLFLDAFERSGGNVERAGARIGWGRSESYRRAKLYGLS